MRLLIIGAGGHGQVIRELAGATGQYKEIKFLDDRFGTKECPDQVIGRISDYGSVRERFDWAFVAIGNAEVRKEYHEKLRKEMYLLATIVHPDAYISPSAIIGTGSVVMPKAVVQTNCRIGEGCIISAGAVVDHDARIGDYCHINAGALVASYRTVGEMVKVDYKEVYR